MRVTTIGIDLAKHVFQVHGVDARWKYRCSPQIAPVRRDQVYR